MGPGPGPGPVPGPGLGPGPWTPFGSLWGALGLHFAVPEHLWDPLWAAGVPLAPFVSLWGAFVGCPWAPFVSLWDAFGSLCLPLGCLWLPLAVLWGPFGLPWDPLGQLLDFLKSKLHCCEQMCKNHCKTQQDLAFWNLPPEPAESPESPEVVSASAAQTPPSTRAGGQDDGSTQTRRALGSPRAYIGFLWLHLAVLWGPFGLPWDPLRRTLDFLKNERHLCEQMCQNHCKTQQDVGTLVCGLGAFGSLCLPLGSSLRANVPKSL